MAQRKGNSFGELFEDNGSMANTGELPQEPAGDEEVDEDELGNELDSDLANIADDLATALVGAMDSVLGGEAGDDLADVPDMLDKSDDAPGAEGDPEQDHPSDIDDGEDGEDEMPPAPAGDDEPDGVDLPDRDHDDEDESMEGEEEGGGDVHDKLDSLESKLDLLLKDEEGEQNEGETMPPGSEDDKPELEEEGDENKMVEAGDENKMLENFFNSIKKG